MYIRQIENAKDRDCQKDKVGAKLHHIEKIEKQTAHLIDTEMNEKRARQCNIK